MIPKPLVSIIIPAYNGEKYLSEAIESVLAQDYLNYEIWLLDNASTDQTKQIGQSFSKVNYIYSNKANTALARHQGVLLARGEYIAFLDQDDTWTSDKLTKQVEFLESNKQYGAVVCQQKIYLQPGTSKPAWLKQQFLETPQSGYLPSALMVRRDTFAITDNFDTAFSQASDVAWFFKAIHQGVLIGTIEEPLTHRRIHHDNASNQYAELHSEILSVIKSSLKFRRGA